MKCPNDQMEMEEMSLKGSYGAPFITKKDISVIGILFKRQFVRLIPWMCAKCGKVEFYTKTDKERNK